jgi:3-hydroxyisobutyrate dehydrogenase-like beta-hydroxyacid dehydrogenase
MTAAISPVGFVGVGQMGGAMAVRTAEQGIPVIVFDVDPAASSRVAEAGADVASSAAGVAARSAVVSVVVNTDDQLVAVFSSPDGVLGGASPGLVVAVHSTVHTSTLQEVAELARSRDVTVIDAAVTGGQHAAMRGELAVMVGGDADAFRRVEPAFEAYASLIVRMGDVGAGLAAKIALNLISFVKLAAAYEGLTLAQAAGVDRPSFISILRHSEAHAGLHDFYLDRPGTTFDDSTEEGRQLLALARRESPKSQKDLSAALELASRVGIEIPVTGVAYGEMPAVWGVPGAGARRPDASVRREG